MSRAWILSTVAVAACGGTEPDIVLDAVVDSARDSAVDAAIDASFDVECPPGNDVIYALEKSGVVFRFDPVSKELVFHGKAICPVPDGLAANAISIDRFGFAWIFYVTGPLVKVHLSALETSCVPVPFDNDPYNLLGMAFSSDTAGGSAESLFIAGAKTYADSTSVLAKLDPTTFAVTDIGTAPEIPELTGTANADLWGFVRGTEARIFRIDKTDGTLHDTLVFDELGLVTEYGDSLAYARWGGHHWVIYRRAPQFITSIYELDATGTIVSTTTTPKSLAGAAVSTCAPP